MQLNNDPEYEAFIKGFALLDGPDESLLQVSRQEAIESQYNRKHLDAKIRGFLLEHEDTQALVAMGQQLLLQWLLAPCGYSAKAERKNLLCRAMGEVTPCQLVELAFHTFSQEAFDALEIERSWGWFPIKAENDKRSLKERLDETAGKLNNLVLEVFTCTASLLDPMPFVSVAAILAPRLNVPGGLLGQEGCNAEVEEPDVVHQVEHLELQAVTLAGELLAVLADTDAFDILKPAKYASMTVENRIALPMRITAFMLETEYLPPMVCKPLELTHNFSSGYLTHNDSLILQRGNHHDGEICLDVLNRMNSVALALNTEFLSKVEEEPNTKPATPIEQAQWDRFKRQSYRFYMLMMRCGNRWFLTHKVDKRGRIYACGYHLNTQGAPFKRASIELARKELVTGIPSA